MIGDVNAFRAGLFMKAPLQVLEELRIKQVRVLTEMAVQDPVNEL
jgi:hypothetical protein